MSMATTRWLARLEQTASSLRTHPVLVAVDQAGEDRLAADHQGALIIVMGVPRAARGLRA